MIYLDTYKKCFPKDLHKIEEIIHQDQEYHNNLNKVIIHRDLHLNNLKIKNSKLYVFDWDDCSLSPIEKEIGIHFFYTELAIRDKSKCYFKDFLTKIEKHIQVNHDAVWFYYRMRFISMFIWCHYRYSTNDMPKDREFYIKHIFKKLMSFGFQPKSSLIDNDLNIDNDLSLMPLIGDEIIKS